jgi:thiol-disulfide isomerase/thioredoxin|tara:strand:- start:44 stop:619 length:576 start_codon:yes stop_codon:yes gene_type:complete
MIYLLLLLACAAELRVSDTDLDSEPAEEIPALGITATDDCSQATIGDKACNIVLLDQNGEVWQSYKQENKVIVLDFSTSWCPPCQAAGHRTQSLQDQYNGEVVVATILIDGYDPGIPATNADVEEWADTHNITSAPVLQGSRETIFDNQGINGYAIDAFPTYVYIDRDGFIYLAHSGYSEEYVKQTIEELL